jgi:integrase
MASITKRKYWADPNTGKPVPRGTPGAVLRESPYYRIRYLGAGGRLISAKGYTDLRSTQQLAARLQAAAARGEEGLVDRYAQHDRRPLREHLADYLLDLEMHGRDDKYRYTMRKRLERLMRECKWTRLRDVTAESFDTWRREQFRAGKRRKSGQTLNQWLDSARAFLNWLAAGERRRIAENPIAGLTPLPETATFARRALREEEIKALYEAAPDERRRVYAFALTTGLRRQEIADLQWGDVKIDVPSPFLQLRESATKARRADVFAIKEEIAEMLKALRPAGWGETDPVFAEVPTVDQLRQDLAQGGVELPEDADADRIDFHALRTTLGSFIGRSGIAERVGMQLLRVTDPKLLRQTYCDPRILQTSQGLANVSVPTPAAAGSAPAAVVNPVVNGGENRVSFWTNEMPRPCPALSVQEGRCAVLGSGEVLEIQGVVSGPDRPCLTLSASDENSAGRIRTYQKMSMNIEDFRISRPAGQLIVKCPAPAHAEPDRLLEGVNEAWPRVPLESRLSILHLTRVAASAQEAFARKGKGAYREFRAAKRFLIDISRRCKLRYFPRLRKFAQGRGRPPAALGTEQSPPELCTAVQAGFPFGHGTPPQGHGGPSFTRSTQVSVRAKFRVERIIHHSGNQREVVLYAVTSGEGNAAWSKYTPSGKLEMLITNPAAFEQFEVEKEYFLDFTPAAAPASA